MLRLAVIAVLAGTLIDPGVLLEEALFVTASFAAIMVLEHFLQIRALKKVADYESELASEAEHERQRLDFKWWLQRHELEKNARDLERQRDREDADRARKLDSDQAMELYAEQYWAAREWDEHDLEE